MTLNANMHYQSPEMSDAEFHSEKTDIFSLGVILYEMCFFEHPWPKQSSVCQTLEVQSRILNGNLKFGKKGREISEPMQNLLNSMLRFKETERMSFEELFSHPFFKTQLEEDLKKVIKKMKADAMRQLALSNDNRRLVKSDDPNSKKYEPEIEKVDPYSQQYDCNKMEKEFCSFLENIRNPPKIKNLNNITEEESGNESGFEEIKSNRNSHDKMGKEIQRKSETRKNLNLKTENGPTFSEIMEEEKEDSQFGNKISVFRSQKKNDSSINRENEPINLDLKKERNKIIFLEYFDEKINNFKSTIAEISIENKNILRILIQKLKIAIILNFLSKIEAELKKSEISTSKSPFSQADHEKFIKILGESIEKYSEIQKLILREATVEWQKSKGLKILGVSCFCSLSLERKSSIYLKEGKRKNWVLDLLNPQIKKTEFLDVFSSLVGSLMRKMGGYIERRREVEHQNDEYGNILNFYKEFVVLLNIEKVFTEMKDEEVREFSKEIVMNNEEIINQN